jgi:hypothetical protein
MLNTGVNAEVVRLLRRSNEFCIQFSTQHSAFPREAADYHTPLSGRAASAQRKGPRGGSPGGRVQPLAPARAGWWKGRGGGRARFPAGALDCGLPVRHHGGERRDGRRRDAHPRVSVEERGAGPRPSGGAQRVMPRGLAVPRPPGRERAAKSWLGDAGAAPGRAVETAGKIQSPRLRMTIEALNRPRPAVAGGAGGASSAPRSSRRDHLSPGAVPSRFRVSRAADRRRGQTPRLA